MVNNEEDKKEEVIPLDEETYNLVCEEIEEFSDALNKEDIKQQEIVIEKIARKIIDLSELKKRTVYTNLREKVADSRENLTDHRTGGLSRGDIEKICKDIYKKVKQERQEELDKSKQKDTLTQSLGMFTDYLNMAEKFYKVQPFFYGENKMWWFWNSKETKWIKIDDIDIMNSVDEHLKHISNLRTTDSKIKFEIIEALKRIGRKNKPKNPEKTWVQFKNKIVDLTTGNTFFSTPDYFFTNPIPYSIGKTDETPVLDSLFKDWVVEADINQDETYIITLYEIIAYAMLSYQPLQRMFAFTGSGSNGKGTFLIIIRTFLGKDNVCTSELEKLGNPNNRFESNKLYRKLCCQVSEVNESDIKNTKLLKALTGEDLIDYEFKGKDGFSEDSYTTIIASTNTLPDTSDKSDGYYRRWLTIDFPHQFSISDVLSKIPNNEYENLANKCIKIAKTLLERRTFTNEGTIQDRKKKYEDKSMPLIKFIKEYCIKDGSKKIAFWKFYEKYFTFLKDKKLREESEKSVVSKLKEYGYELATEDYYTKYVNEQGYESEKRHRWQFIYGLDFKVYGTDGTDGSQNSTDFLIRKLSENPLPSLPSLPNQSITEEVIGDS